jgi:hypothetical protein
VAVLDHHELEAGGIAMSATTEEHRDFRNVLAMILRAQRELEQPVAAAEP